MLPLMDKLFGTSYQPKKQWPLKYGIQGPMSAGLLGQLVHPFLPESDQPQLPEEAVNAATPSATDVLSRARRERFFRAASEHSPVSSHAGCNLEDRCGHCS